MLWGAFAPTPGAVLEVLRGYARAWGWLLLGSHTSHECLQRWPTCQRPARSAGMAKLALELKKFSVDSRALTFP